MKAKEEEKEEEKKKKDSKWSDKFFKKARFKKPTKVAVIYLRENGIAEPMEVESKNGLFTIGRKTYHERKDCTYTITKERIPLAIIPEWSPVPLGTKIWEEKPMYEKFNELQDHVLRGIRHAELVKMGEKERGKISVKQAVIAGIVVIVGLALLTNFL